MNNTDVSARQCDMGVALTAKCRTRKVRKIHDVALLPYVWVDDAPEGLDERLYVRLLLH